MNQKERVIIIHECCSKGFKQFLDFKIKYKIEKGIDIYIAKQYTFLDVYKLKLDKLYNFDINELKQGSYVIFENDINNKIYLKH